MVNFLIGLKGCEDLERSKALLGLLTAQGADHENFKALVAEGIALVKASGDDETISQLGYYLGDYLLKNGRLDEAEAMFERSLAINLSVYGEHPYTAAAWANLGDLAIHQGVYDVALVNYSNAVEIAEATVGIEAPFTIVLNRKIGACYRIIEENGKAIAYFTKAMVGLENTGDNEPMLADVYLNLGEIYHEIGESQYAFACEFYEKSYEIFKKTLGETHDITNYVARAIKACVIEAPVNPF